MHIFIVLYAHIIGKIPDVVLNATFDHDVDDYEVTFAKSWRSGSG